MANVCSSPLPNDLMFDILDLLVPSWSSQDKFIISMPETLLPFAMTNRRSYALATEAYVSRRAVVLRGYPIFNIKAKQQATVKFSGQSPLAFYRAGSLVLHVSLNEQTAPKKSVMLDKLNLQLDGVREIRILLSGSSDLLVLVLGQIEPSSYVLSTDSSDPNLIITLLEAVNPARLSEFKLLSLIPGLSTPAVLDVIPPSVLALTLAVGDMETKTLPIVAPRPRRSTKCGITFLETSEEAWLALLRCKIVEWTPRLALVRVQVVSPSINAIMRILDSFSTNVYGTAWTRFEVVYEKTYWDSDTAVNKFIKQLPTECPHWSGRLLYVRGRQSKRIVLTRQ
ncbi:hypothetical protein H9P43_003693 [Blastocladiella emersonii ATCC 22665]|nr:hypothetical protein H9P43_003693 [Blastocladiella emersonii ATCC 22665]